MIYDFYDLYKVIFPAGFLYMRSLACVHALAVTRWRLLSAVMIYRIEIDIPKAFISYNLVISHNTFIVVD